MDECVPLLPQTEGLGFEYSGQYVSSACLYNMLDSLKSLNCITVGVPGVQLGKSKTH